MAEYLEDWCHASRREPYYDQHKNGGYNFRGYWPWEAAAITHLLDIDDHSYAQAQFYPAGLVAFARPPKTLTTPSAANPPPPTNCVRNPANLAPKPDNGNPWIFHLKPTTSNKAMPCPILAPLTA